MGNKNQGGPHGDRYSLANYQKRYQQSDCF